MRRVRRRAPRGACWREGPKQWPRRHPCQLTTKLHEGETRTLLQYVREGRQVTGAEADHPATTRGQDSQRDARHVPGRSRSRSWVGLHRLLATLLLEPPATAE